MPRVASIATAHIAIAAILFAALTACSQSERGEHVFSRQNRVASALATVIMEAEAQEGATVERFYDAESELDDACRALREAAILKMNGKSSGLESEILIFVSLDHCAAETKRIERLVRRSDPEVARFYLGPEPVVLRQPQ